MASSAPIVSLCCAVPELMTASFSTLHKATKYISLALSSNLEHYGVLRLTSKYFKVLVISNSETCIIIPVNFQVSAKLAFEHITSWKVTPQILLLGAKCLIVEKEKF